MNVGLRTLLSSMLSRKIIGGKHIPERLMIRMGARWLPKEELREFENEYKQALNEHWIIRMKKRTGGGSEWHISLNPREVKAVREKIG